VEDVWQRADSYERYIGRWSRGIAREFVAGLAVEAGGVWVDVGCGSGALTAAILGAAAPVRVVAVDRSIEFVDDSRGLLADSRVAFAAADAVALPFVSSRADAVVSALVLNFVPRPDAALREMLRCVRPGGAVAVYVWDYAEGMEPIRRFWDAAAALDPDAEALDEAKRFPLCNPRALEDLFRGAGAAEVRVSSITIPTRFHDFHDFWSPFLGGQGPAPTYTVYLPEPRRIALRERLRETLPASAGGAIELRARAWVARGTRP
jgi:SAM-dependent methyltransferase